MSESWGVEWYALVWIVFIGVFGILRLLGYAVYDDFVLLVNRLFVGGLTIAVVRIPRNAVVGRSTGGLREISG